MPKACGVACIWNSFLHGLALLSYALEWVVGRDIQANIGLDPTVGLG